VSGLRRSVSFGGGRVLILKSELVLNDEKFSFGCLCSFVCI
jgi:hypothetical protein